MADITILDHTEGISVPGDLFARPANEYWALICLRAGLAFLNRQVLRGDAAMRDRVDPDGTTRVFLSFNAPQFQGMPLPLLTASFMWFAVSACQYVRLVGAICAQNGRLATPKEQKAYLHRVLGPVVPFRDKVAAHFAFSSRHEMDNEAERIASVIPQLSFDGDRFIVGAWTMTLKKSGKESGSGVLAPWSLTEVYERLRLRYWPDEIPERTRPHPTGGEPHVASPATSQEERPE